MSSPTSLPTVASDGVVRPTIADQQAARVTPVPAHQQTQNTIDQALAER